MKSPAISFVVVLFFTNLLLPLVVEASSSSSSSSSSSYDFLECLTRQSESSNSIIYTPTNASYASLLSAENTRPLSTSPLKPLLIMTPFYEYEIQQAIHCSKKLGIQIRLRSGGHDYEGLSYTSHDNPFVVVDMRNFKSISIDTEAKTAWVQVGATLGQLYHAIAKKSKTLAFTAGVCPTVGVGGHFSGGGYGMMSRKHAIAADYIIDAILINADGQILDRSSMGEDLFWAIRGGGGTSFGIFLAFKVKLVTVPEIVTVFNVSRTSEQNATELVDRWQYVANKVDDSLLIRLFLHSVRSPTNPGRRTVLASFTSLYLGRAHHLVPLMQKEFPELGVVEQDCIEMSWIESVLYFGGYPNQPLDVLLSRVPPYSIYFKGKSDYVTQPIPVHGLREMWRFLHEEGETKAELQLSPYGGAMSNFTESETPFPHRSGNLFLIQYGVYWNEQGNAKSGDHVNWVRRLYSYMTPYVSKSPRAAYFNYRDIDLGINVYSQTGDNSISYDEASVWGLKYFKNNFQRLVRVKTKVDPTNFFRNEQSIPPMSSRRDGDSEATVLMHATA